MWGCYPSDVALDITDSAVLLEKQAICPSAGLCSCTSHSAYTANLLMVQDAMSQLRSWSAGGRFLVAYQIIAVLAVYLLITAVMNQSDTFMLTHQTRLLLSLGAAHSCRPAWFCCHHCKALVHCHCCMGHTCFVMPSSVAAAVCHVSCRRVAVTALVLYLLAILGFSLNSVVAVQPFSKPGVCLQRFNMTSNAQPSLW